MKNLDVGGMELLNCRWLLDLIDVGDLPSKASLTLEMSPTVQERFQLYDPRHSSVMVTVTLVKGTQDWIKATVLRRMPAQT